MKTKRKKSDPVVDNLLASIKNFREETNHLRETLTTTRKMLTDERETVRQAKLEIEGLKNNITGLVFAISCARDNAHGWAIRAAWLESRQGELALAD